MLFYTDWLIPSRVIYQHFGYRLPDYDVLRHMLNQELAMIESGTPPVHMIVNMADMKEYPRDIKVLLNSWTHEIHPNTGWVIHISQDALVRFFTPIIIQARNRFDRIRTFQSLLPALEFLKHMNPDLDSLDTAGLLRQCEQFRDQVETDKHRS